MSVIDDMRKGATMLEAALQVIAIAQSVTGMGGLAATEAIKVISAAVKSFVDNGAGGTLTSDEVLAELARLRSGFAADDAAADAALAARGV